MRRIFNRGAANVEDEWTVWWDQSNSKHAWAFIHFCRRKGDVVYVKGDRRTLNIAIKRKLDE